MTALQYTTGTPTAGALAAAARAGERLAQTSADRWDRICPGVTGRAGQYSLTRAGLTPGQAEQAAARLRRSISRLRDCLAEAASAYQAVGVDLDVLLDDINTSRKNRGLPPLPDYNL